MVMHVCSVDGCEKIEENRTTCRMHYERFRRNGKYEPLTPEERSRAGQGTKPYVMPEVKACSRCKKVKTASEFYIARVDGVEKLYSHCKECHAGLTNKSYIKRRDAARAERAARKANPRNGGICEVEGCDNKMKVLSSGLCSMHYARSRNGTPMEQPKRERRQSEIAGSDFRLCTICDGVFHQSSFYKRPSGAYLSQCKVCSVGLSKVRQAINRYNDISRAREFANSYSGRLKVRSLEYIERAVESGKIQGLLDEG